MYFGIPALDLLVLTTTTTTYMHKIIDGLASSYRRKKSPGQVLEKFRGRPWWAWWTPLPSMTAPGFSEMTSAPGRAPQFQAQFLLPVVCLLLLPYARNPSTTYLSSSTCSDQTGHRPPLPPSILYLALDLNLRLLSRRRLHPGPSTPASSPWSRSPAAGARSRVVNCSSQRAGRWITSMMGWNS